MDKQIPLEIEHIDGNNKNNNKDNLTVLCPNCHALTDTWRGRNKSSSSIRKYKVDNITLLNSLIKNNWNYRQTLLEVNLTPKGGNYNRCHSIKREYEEYGIVLNNEKLRHIDKDEFTSAFNSCSNNSEISNLLRIGYEKTIKYLNLYDLRYTNNKKELPGKEELLENYKMLGSLLQLGKLYGISDNGIRKWFIKYGIDPKKLKEI